MYVDFPEGRLKFFGTLVFPASTKYLMLKINPKDILCEDVFESLVRPPESETVAWGEDKERDRET